MTKLIRNWDELKGLESNDYYIEVDEYAGWIKAKSHIKVTSDNYFDHNQYLSTHTFYGKHYKMYTKLLQKYGFDVQLKNWDGETEWYQKED